MIAVANASPICYLVLIGEIELLPKLFSKVVVPRAVIEELLAERAPASVRSWALALRRPTLISLICQQPSIG